MSEEKPTKEERILRVMRKVLVDIIKDTTTMPGMKHPLTGQTRDEIRHCLDLITARQVEIAEAAGIPMKERPVFADDPRKSVVVQMNPAGSRKDSSSQPDTPPEEDPKA
jgi:hypothetical protein